MEFLQKASVKPVSLPRHNVPTTTDTKSSNFKTLRRSEILFWGAATDKPMPNPFAAQVSIKSSEFASIPARPNEPVPGYARLEMFCDGSVSRQTDESSKWWMFIGSLGRRHVMNDRLLACPRARANVLAKTAGFPHKRAAFDVRLTPAAEQTAVHNYTTRVEEPTGKRWQRSGRWIFNNSGRARRWKLL